MLASRLLLASGLLAAALLACSAPEAAAPEGHVASSETAATTGAGGSKGSKPTSSAFGCDGKGIAGFADQLADRAVDACTSDGPGIVTDSNYECLKDPIFALAPPFPDAAYARVVYWAQNGNNFSGKTSLLQCVDFAFIVTAAVCGEPVNGGDANIDENMSIPGYRYMSSSDGDPAPGDVLVMDGHIAITAEVVDSNDIRIAEANCLEQDGSESNGEDTGVISNSRTDTVDDSWIKGWYRKE